MLGNEINQLIFYLQASPRRTGVPERREAFIMQLLNVGEVPGY